jgi:hypothetical protein
MVRAYVDIVQDQAHAVCWSSDNLALLDLDYGFQDLMQRAFTSDETHFIPLVCLRSLHRPRSVDTE